MTQVGLIARSNARGLGSQTYEAWRGYKFAKVLHVLDGSARWPERPDLYPGAHIVHWTPGAEEPLDREVLASFMDGLDAIFSVETLYDWSLVWMARDRHVRTVVQANPEFMRHNGLGWEDTPHPTTWCFPTPWLIDEMPSRRILPVPIPNDAPHMAGDPDAERLTVVHVAGHRANGDRNGTEMVLEAMRLIRSPVKLRIIGQDGPNTIFMDRAIIHPPNVELELIEIGVADRWDLYRDAHIVLLPRRYGGLCLPAIEGIAAGVVPFMPNCPPNEIWPVQLMPSVRGRAVRTPFGYVESAMVHAMYIAHLIDDYHRDRGMLRERLEAGAAWAASNTWDSLRYMYDEIFDERS